MNDAPPPPALTEVVRLNDLMVRLHGEGKFAEATRYAERCLALIEKLCTDGPAVARALHNLAVLYVAQGAYERAESTRTRELAILEKAHPPIHPDIATTLYSLGMLCKKQGRHSSAEPLFKRALVIREQALGATHPDVAASLDQLSEISCVRGAYAHAVPLLERALTIREQALGATHLDTAESLYKLSMAHQEQGEYDRAEPLLERALSVFETTRGATHFDVAKCLNNLAMMYRDQGSFRKGTPLLERSLAIFERSLGPAHPTTAVALHNVASRYPQERAAQAAALHQRALTILEAALGPMHPHVAISLASLASHHRRQRAYDQAEPLYQRALAILEAALGSMHPELASCLGGLAMLYWERGAHAQAEALWLRALDISERVLGAMHPAVATHLRDLAALHASRGEHAKAFAAVVRAAEIHDDQLRRELAWLPISRQRSLLAHMQRETECIVSLHVDAMSASAEALELALTTIVRRKGRIVHSLAESQLNLLGNRRSELRDTIQQLSDTRTQLLSHLRRSFQPHDAESNLSEVIALRGRIEDLEAKLYAASAELRAQPETVTVPAVRAALPRGAVLIEFVHYAQFIPGEVEPWGEPRYAAYVLPWQGPPRSAALGGAAAIDAAIDATLVDMRAHRDRAAATGLQRLHALVFEPLRGWLAGASHIIISPDAKLHLVPFEALQDADGHHVLEHWLVSYLGTAGDLLRLRNRRAPRSAATIVAAPDYGTPHDRAHQRFAPLEGALAEAQALPAYLARVRVLTGAQASKAALASAVGPSVLHIATHGFFELSGLTFKTSDLQPDAAAPPSMIASTTQLRVPRDVTAPATELVASTGTATFIPLPSEFESLVDPLDRAGLALAGANGEADGIVMARELAGYDWWGTQLVVLSACDTGLGATASGDGVHGMRSALVQAGTETQVVSLWNVSDSSTPELMREFYRELARGTGRAEALRQAKLRLLARAGFKHPYYWAAFILAGDWTPLASNVIRPSVAHGAPREPMTPAPSRVTVTGLNAVSDWRPLTTHEIRPGSQRPRADRILAPAEGHPLCLPDDLEFSVVLLMTPEQLGKRVEPKAIAKQVEAVLDEITGLYARGEVRPAPMALFVAMKPQRRIKVWVVGIDCEFAAEDVALVERRARTWRAPAVSGPVTLAYAFARKEPPLLEAPRLPRAWLEASARAGKTLALPDEVLASVWPD